MKRLVVIDFNDTQLKLINPKMISQSGVQECVEGCLSFPNRFVKTIRPQKVTIQALNEYGEEMIIDRCRFGKRKRGLMSKVIMMCGVCGSGKTTYAKKKEQEGYIRLSIDEEMWKLYGRKGIDYPEEQYEKLSEQVEAALQKKLLSLIQQGKDVVIDFSFWSKENRNVYKELIQKAGAETELVYMKVSKELLQKRLHKRNQVLNANSPFVITDELLEHHYHAFQEPCGEGEKVILQKEDIMQ